MCSVCYWYHSFVYPHRSLRVCKLYIMMALWCGEDVSAQQSWDSGKTWSVSWRQTGCYHGWERTQNNSEVVKCTICTMWAWVPLSWWHKEAPVIINTVNNSTLLQMEFFSMKTTSACSQVSHGDASAFVCFFFAASNRTIGPWSPRSPHREQTETTSAWTYQSDTPEYLMPDISNVNNTVPLHVLHPSERYATGATLRLIFDSNLSLQTSELLCWSQERSRCLATHTHAHTLVRPYSLELVFDHGSSTVLQIQRVKNNECVVYNHNKKNN